MAMVNARDVVADTLGALVEEGTMSRDDARVVYGRVDREIGIGDRLDKIPMLDRAADVVSAQGVTSRQQALSLLYDFYEAHYEIAKTADVMLSRGKNFADLKEHFKNSGNKCIAVILNKFSDLESLGGRSPQLNAYYTSWAYSPRLSLYGLNDLDENGDPIPTKTELAQAKANAMQRGQGIAGPAETRGNSMSIAGSGGSGGGRRGPSRIGAPTTRNGGGEKQ